MHHACQQFLSAFYELAIEAFLTPAIDLYRNFTPKILNLLTRSSLIIPSGLKTIQRTVIIFSHILQNSFILWHPCDLFTCFWPHSFMNAIYLPCLKITTDKKWPSQNAPVVVIFASTCSWILRLMIWKKSEVFEWNYFALMIRTEDKDKK